MHDHHREVPDERAFSEAPISRRQFVRLSAATGGALALPGAATADAESGAFDAEYQYVLNHTPEDFRVPTLIRFSRPSGVDAFEALSVGSRVRTTTEPEPAAYAQLTTVEAQEVADLPTAAEFEHSPGSNPFWRLGYYPLGVFPEPRRSVDFISFEQLKDGLEVLEAEFPDRVNVRTVGHSPGHYNNVTDREDPKDMIVVEVTNDVQDREAFADKEQVFFSCSLHGLEAAGRETGARVVENVARGSEPDIEGNDETVEPYLDDAVLLVGFTNPDGWVARNPQYDSGWQLAGPGTEYPRVPGAPLYERGNAEVYDTNRQYPIVGGIDPVHYPAYVPEGDHDPNDVPSFVYEKVPDAAAFVEFFREYDNLNYGADLHGMPVSNEFVLGLVSNDQFDTRELHEIYEMCLAIDETLSEALGEWQTVGETRSDLLGDDQFDPALYGVVPRQAFDYGTIYDTIGYTVSGAMLDWMAHPAPVGLDMTTLDFEMSFNHMAGGNGPDFVPELYEMEVTGYRTAIRTITAFAVRNSETPTTDDEFDAYTETGGDRVAYVTPGAAGTDDDALRRTDATLEFDGGDGDGCGDGSGGVAVSQSTTTADLDADESTTVVETVEEGLHSLRVHLHATDALVDAELVSPDGEVVRSFEGVTDDRVGGKCCGLPEWVVADPEPGEWTVRVSNLRDAAGAVDVNAVSVQTAATNPDPGNVESWDCEGYEQLEYDVTPFEFFEDYAAYVDDGGSFEEVTVEEVADGALVDGGDLAYDHVVVVHDYGANADADYIGGDAVPGYTDADHPAEGFDVDGYVAALDEFVDAGGNLLLTDAGVRLLGALDNGLVDGEAYDSAEDFVVETYDVANFTDKDLEHPLLTDVREIQNELWKGAPLGYEVTGEAPMHLIDEAAFEESAEGEASVAGHTDDYVAAGSITEAADSGRGVHVVSSLLPPATQRNLHPFGLQAYAVSFLGNLVFTSALGFRQVRETADVTRRYGRGDEWEYDEGDDGDGGDELSASGDREVDSNVALGGNAYRVQVTLESVEGAETVEVLEEFPEEWELLERFGHGELLEEGLLTFGEVDADDLETTFTYYVEAPDAPEESGPYQFGPARVDDGDDEAEFAGTDDVVAFGVEI